MYDHLNVRVPIDVSLLVVSPPRLRLIALSVLEGFILYHSSSDSRTAAFRGRTSRPHTSMVVLLWGMGICYWWLDWEDRFAGSPYIIRSILFYYSHLARKSYRNIQLNYVSPESKGNTLRQGRSSESERSGRAGRKKNDLQGEEDV